MAWTPILHEHQKWHNHLPNKTIVCKEFFFRMYSIIKCARFMYCIYASLSDGMTSPTAPHSSQGFSAGRTVATHLKLISMRGILPTCLIVLR